MTNEEYIAKNRETDIRPLALKSAPEGVDVSWCLRQIEGYQIAKKKLPAWSQAENVWYPPRLSMEQCSSEVTAKYKQSLAEKLVGEAKKATLVDLTGGFGVDFTYMAKNFGTTIYVEQQKVLCDVARHNFPLFGLTQSIIEQTDSVNILNSINMVDVIYIDPARRDDAGKKTVAISDCTPDLNKIQDLIFSKARYAIVKLSPMLDITQALRTLKKVTEIHVVSVKGECKELLFVQDASANQGNQTIVVRCQNLETHEAALAGKINTPIHTHIIDATPDSLSGLLLFEPNASILKAGMQDEFAKHYNLQKLHPQTNLFVCNPENVQGQTIELMKHIPARSFMIVDAGDFSKNSMKRLTGNLKRANLTIRNFPTSVAELRKRLKLKEGGTDYLFATTLNNGKHVLLKCVPHRFV